MCLLFAVVISGSHSLVANKEGLVPWEGFSQDPDWKYLEEYYVRQVKKYRLPTVKELAVALKKRTGKSELTTAQWRTLRRFRRRWLALAAHARIGPPRLYMNFVLFRPGNLFCDVAFMPKGYKGHNDMKNCMFVASEAGTQLCFATPMSGTSMPDFGKAIREMYEVSAFEKPHTLWSDREKALSSKSFQKEMTDLYGLRFQFLKYRHKAFAAERQIRTLKESLHALMELNGTRRWVGPLLQEVVRRHNQGRAHGTSFKRTQVSSNWNAFLKEFLDVPVPSAVMSASGAESFEIGGHRRYSHLLWPLQTGDPVLLHRSGYSETAEKNSQLKRSVVGKAGRRVFYVHRRLLKSTNQLGLVPVFQLRLGPEVDSEVKSGYYYPR